VRSIIIRDLRGKPGGRRSNWHAASSVLIDVREVLRCIISRFFGLRRQKEAIHKWLLL